jgi:hypothetical protein
MSALVSREHLDDFRRTLESRTVSVPAIRLDGVTFFGATPEEAAGHERVMVSLRASPDLEGQIEKYGLGTQEKESALTAIRQFKTRSSILSESERSVLLDSFRGLLTWEQRDDLRAALGRRPVVRLGSVPVPMRLESQVSPNTPNRPGS